MYSLDFVNYVLSLIGEQPLLSSAGNLGTLVRNSIYSSTLAVIQSTRASFFEQMLTGTATNADYLVPAMSLPEEVIQVLEVMYVANDSLVPLTRVELTSMASYQSVYTYDIVGSNVYLNKTIVRPANLRVRALVLPTLPTADDALFSIPKPLQPAIAHGAASLLCLTYVDDANASAQHKRIADELTLGLRQQFGLTRGRTFSLGN